MATKKKAVAKTKATKEEAPKVAEAPKLEEAVVEPSVPMFKVPGYVWVTVPEKVYSQDTPFFIDVPGRNDRLLAVEVDYSLKVNAQFPAARDALRAFCDAHSLKFHQDQIAEWHARDLASAGVVLGSARWERQASLASDDWIVLGILFDKTEWKADFKEPTKAA